MIHTDVIARLRALGTIVDGPACASEIREAMSAHVARCADCWHALADLHRGVTGDAPLEDTDVTSRFDCDTTREVLYTLVELDAASIARDHAPAARHLGWCLACRARFAELVLVEREFASAPRWIEVGERVREAVGRLVVRVGRTLSGLVEIPDAFVLVPCATAAPVRGATAPATSQSTRFRLGDRDVWAELTVDADDVVGTGLTVQLTSDVAETLSLRLREARADGDALVGRYTLRGTEPVLVRGLWPGSFMLEIHDPHDARIHRVRLDIGPGA
jgi:hypothetical protein